MHPEGKSLHEARGLLPPGFEKPSETVETVRLSDVICSSQPQPVFHLDDVNRPSRTSPRVDHRPQQHFDARSQSPWMGIQSSDAKSRRATTRSGD
jgi:hypothetical protein